MTIDKTNTDYDRAVRLCGGNEWQSMDSKSYRHPTFKTMAKVKSVMDC